MGVLFYAGRGLTKLDKAPLLASADYDNLAEEDYDDPEDVFFVEGNPRAPQLAEGVEVNAGYRCAETMFFSFPHWTVCRDWVGRLRDLVGCTREEAMAEGSTVAFRDFFVWTQDGTVGPRASARLAVQFAEWDERAKTFADEEFYDIFAAMREMFEWCSEDGLVFLRSA